MKLKPDNLIEFDRRPEISERIAGFVVASGPDLVLVHRLDWNTFLLDGYCAIRRPDIRRCLVLNKSGSWQAKALRAKSITPSPLSVVSVNSLADLLVSSASVFPLVNVQTELQDDEVCYIGRVTELCAKSFTLSLLNFHARWKGIRRFRFSDVTRVEFGSGYERALAISAGKGPQTPNYQA